ncbi:hypothetical protein AGLY_004585 [Aphis glycines]|uniref:Uncharacterized protein n=1 Tax=Aphis glycines TaxID=307491 RepID=A0A6G0TWN9_APHGL|nr:hypothetical protein AGLY_004585 [Aphis glycines]
MPPLKPPNIPPMAKMDTANEYKGTYFQSIKNTEFDGYKMYNFSAIHQRKSEKINFKCPMDHLDRERLMLFSFRFAFCSENFKEHLKHKNIYNINSVHYNICHFTNVIQLTGRYSLNDIKMNMLGESFCIIDIILVRWSRTTRLFPRDYETELYLLCAKGLSDHMHIHYNL